MNFLIIAEKPNAMKKIAYSLFPNPKLIKIKRVKYFFYKDGINNYFVASAIGHLFSLYPKSNNFSYPIFETEWKIKEGKEYELYANVIKMLSKNSDLIIIATDYDIEGHVIGFNILRFLCNNKPAKRMKFSTLTKEELKHSFSNLIEINLNEVNAGLTRHYLDWIWGINLSRALMISARNFGIKQTLSIGRVQGPTLKLIYDREKEIENFVPKIYYKIKIFVNINGKILQFESKKFEDYKEAQRVYENLINEKYAIVSSISESYYQLNPLPPFDTTELQSEAYSVYGFKPEYTLKIAENLYLNGYISYPRSGSQKLKGINPLPILNSLSKIPQYYSYVQEILSKEIKITEGKKDDPAHPAIIPTNEIPNFSNLSKDEMKLYDLIVRRFLVCLSEPAIRKSVKIKILIKNLEFENTFHSTVKEGWIKIYRKFLDLEEIEVRAKENEKVKIENIKLVKEKTKPPARYTKASLIKELEKRKLGTKTTRHEIILTLYKRKYIKGEKIKITDLGKAIVEIMEKYAPKILSEELTREFEEKLEKIERGEIKSEEVIEEAKNTLKLILEEMKKKEREIGEKIYILNKIKINNRI